ncbi:MAG TPA: 2-oxoglutarate dehydrogenase E1 component [Verrucomicrobiae bacterium]|nr:2-oxoglutarate dehydrogenase E1 component [Verrucomicrobiae bacterium]
MRESADTMGIQSLAYVEQFYADYRRDPNSVPVEWREYFTASANGSDNAVQIGPSFKPRSVFNPAESNSNRHAQFQPDPRAENLSERLHQLVRSYRGRGHIIAGVDPLGQINPCPPELELEFYGFTESELNMLVNFPTLHCETPLTVREIFQRLRDTYCRSIGAQFLHIDSLAERQWLQHRMESSQNRLQVSRDDQLRILTQLTDAVVFEEFLRKKFLGAKTFSLEGCETLLPLLDLAIEKSGHQGVKTIVIGMGHRGRLNVLAHIVGKGPCEIFREFADTDPKLWPERGDVKYHLGHSGDWTMSDGRKIHLSLCFNPSHLEFVNPVVLGRVRAHQDRFEDRDRRQVLGIMIHGDAAFAGEGVVQETLNMSELAGYKVGGVLHIIVNNQIGFTTPPGEGRSTTYATDVARMLQVPIFHVNGEDPEAVAQVVQLAMDFRAEFQSDVFIDMYGYRRLGHNETDEPTFTQPVLYRKISERKNVREGYLGHLLELKNVSREEADKILAGCHAKLENQLQAARADKCETVPERRSVWRDYIGGPEPAVEPDTGVEIKKLSPLLHKLTAVPTGFRVHVKLDRMLAARREMADGKLPLDWAAGEALALATLTTEGARIRLTGQDTGRGTFSQRHAILYDQEDGHPFVPLQHLAPEQSPVEIVNSPLCETGALGFEYGYSLDCPKSLVLWEAQFGDFVNAAQVIIDQFLTSAEAKWRRLSGLVLLLPHGFEGMGPEHSSARLERFLTLTAEDNIQIVQPTTPAQYFHVLRRQAIRNWRKPLIVFTPKSLLRHPKVISSLEDCAGGKFQRVLPDELKSQNVKRILICTGKIYFDLAAYREEHKRNDVAIIRLEQLYPLHGGLLEEVLKPYAEHTPALWVQEEPANMGAWRYLHEKFGKHLFGKFPFAPVSRFESASPATGSSHAHKLEQARLVARAFGDPEPSAEVFAAKESETPSKEAGGEKPNPSNPKEN